MSSLWGAVSYSSDFGRICSSIGGTSRCRRRHSQTNIQTRAPNKATPPTTPIPTPILTPLLDAVEGAVVGLVLVPDPTEVLEAADVNVELLLGGLVGATPVLGLFAPLVDDEAAVEGDVGVDDESDDGLLLAVMGAYPEK